MMDNEATARIEQLERELQVALGEAAESERKYLRSLAEMENFKKRLERSHTELAKSSKKALFGKALTVLDNLDRAVQYEHAASTDPASLIKGLRLTHWQLNDLLQAEGIKPIEALGQVFDPHLHEAVEIDTSGSAAAGIITAVLQKGYYYQDEVLRPAKVKVAAAIRKRVS
ncbi:MAG: nucleotide exchange factor GrpE [Chloroflexota bacterium]